MNKYIVLSIQKEFLVFSQTNKELSPKEFINTNKVYHDKYIYTFKYFKAEHINILGVINKYIYSKKIKKAYLEDNSLLLIVLKFIKLLNIYEIYIRTFKSLSINECNLIINNKYLSYINAFYIPTIYLNKMLKSRKKVNINYRESLTDEFMLEQDVIDIDAVYYKKVLHFKDIKKYQEKDMIEFLKLNQYLVSIHMHVYNKEILESIIKLLIKDSRKNVIIFLYQNDNIQNNFKYLKELNKKFQKDVNGEIKIVYSKNYIKNNLFKQLTYNNIKMSLVIVLYVLFIGLIFTEFYSYASQINIDRLNYELYLKSIENVSSSEINEEPSVTEEVIDKYTLNKDFVTLLGINSDTVGWLKVNNTKVDYPIVQSKNNDYYLKRDFYKTKTSLGWVFMDYRNNSVSLDDNTIIYGHKLKSGLMFGTLDNALKSSWYKNEENQIITFNTVSTTMKWKIFSIYRTEYTTDYLVTKFTNRQTFNAFVNDITSKSIYNFNESLTYGDKILTLSTCIGASSANNRLVVHAKLIKEES